MNPKLSGKKINENVKLANKPRNSPPLQRMKFYYHVQGDVNYSLWSTKAILLNSTFRHIFLKDSTIIFPSTPDSFYDRNFIF